MEREEGKVEVPDEEEEEGEEGNRSGGDENITFHHWSLEMAVNAKDGEEDDLAKMEKKHNEQ